MRALKFYSFTVVHIRSMSGLCFGSQNINMISLLGPLEGIFEHLPHDRGTYMFF